MTRLVFHEKNTASRILAEHPVDRPETEAAKDEWEARGHELWQENMKAGSHEAMSAQLGW